MRWVAAAPTWSAVAGTSGEIRRPTLLAYRNDAFVDVMREQLAPVGSAEPSFGTNRVTASPARFYRPFHGVFQLVALQLVCELPGLPDHKVNAGREKVGFVVRRREGSEELAWIPPARPDLAGSWARLAGTAKDGLHTSAAGNEEVHGLFPMQVELHGVKRKLWAGVIPVAAAKAETIPSTPIPATSEGSSQKLALLAQLRQRVLSPFAVSTPPSSDLMKRSTSTFVLVDLLEILDAATPGWETSSAASTLRGTLSGAEVLRDGVKTSWLSALATVRSEITLILAGTSAAVWRYDLFVPGHVRPTAEALADRVLEASPAGLPLSNVTIVREDDGVEWIVRGVYRRPPCPGHPDVIVSEASHPFTVAPVFDPDAPARTVRIQLPEMTLANLRKYPRNVGIAMSKTMRKKMADGIKNDPPALQPPGALLWDLDVIVHLSIPIVTIVAMLILMIVAYILNMIFWWLPFLWTILVFVYPRPAQPQIANEPTNG